jgi:hypothetical protein
MTSAYPYGSLGQLAVQFITQELNVISRDKVTISPAIKQKWEGKES